MESSLGSHLKNLSGPWWVLLALGPILSIMLLRSLDAPFQDPQVFDAETVVTPRSAVTAGTLTMTGWTRTPDGSGWVPDSADSRLVVQTPPGPWQQVVVRFNGTLSQDYVLRASRDFASESALNVKAGRDYSLAPAQTGPIRIQAPFAVTISPQGAPVDDAVITRVSVLATTMGEDEKQPALYGALLGGFTPLSLALFLLAAGRRTEKQALVLGTVGGGIASMLAAIQPQVMPFLWAAPTSFFLGAAVMGFVRWRRAPESPWRWVAEGAAIMAICCFAVFARWEEYASQVSEPLSPDGRGYVEIAREGSFYRTSQDHAPWIREPLFPAILRTADLFLPETNAAMRFVSLIIGILPVALIWLAGRKVFNPMIGLTAAAFAALNPFMAETGPRVLRDDLMTALLVSLMAIPLYLGERRWARAAAFGMIASALTLTRINMLFLFVPFLAFEAWRRRWRLGEIVLTAAIVILPAIPHLLYNAEVGDGDILYSSNVHTAYYLNRDLIGQPGFPANFAEWQRDPYAGEVVGASVFLQHHSPWTLLYRLIRGYIMIFLYEFPHEMLFRGQEWAMIPGLFGLWALWKRREETVWVIAWTGLFLFPVALIATIGLDRRLALPAVPLILWNWSAGLFEIGRWLWERQIQPRLPKPQQKEISE